MGGSLSRLARHDLEIFMEAYHADWHMVEEKFNIRFLDMMSSYDGGRFKGVVYSHGLRDRIEQLSELLAHAGNVEAMYEALTEFYKDYGVGNSVCTEHLRLKKTVRRR